MKTKVLREIKVIGNESQREKQEDLGEKEGMEKFTWMTYLELKIEGQRVLYQLFYY